MFIEKIRGVANEQKVLSFKPPQVIGYEEQIKGQASERLQVA